MTGAVDDRRDSRVVIAGQVSGHTGAMPDHPRRPVTAESLEASRQRLRELAGEVADTEHRLAATFDHLAETDGDPDGHRRSVAQEARRVEALERRRAAGEDPTQPRDDPSASP